MSFLSAEESLVEGYRRMMLNAKPAFFNTLRYCATWRRDGKRNYGVIICNYTFILTAPTPSVTPFWIKLLAL
jgi:hypothetical protein